MLADGDWFRWLIIAALLSWLAYELVIRVIPAGTTWQDRIAQRGVRFVGPRSVALLVLCGLLLLVGVLVWPTPYRYEKLQQGRDTILMRIHRLTGKAEQYVYGRWLSTQPDQPERRPQSLPMVELTKLSGNAGFEGRGIFSGKLYNGTSWTITEITVRIVARGIRKQLWDRKFVAQVHAPRLSVSRFSFQVTGDEEVVDFDWYILEAKGYPGE